MKYALLLGAIFLSCSCATVVRGTKDTAEFESRPSGANVTVESVSEDKLGPYDCVTPCSLELKRKRTWAVDFTLEGYKPASGRLRPKVTGGGVAAGAGNVLLGGLIGVGVDAGTGANLDLRPNPMIAELEPLDSPNESRVLDTEIDDDAAPTAAGEPAPSAASDTPSAEDLPANDDAAPASVDRESATDAAPQETTAATSGEAATETTDEIAGEPVAQPARLYKPGEVAPNDEAASDLNRRQLEKIENLPQQ